MTKTLEQRVYDAQRAKEVLENEAFAQAFADIEEEYTDAWKNSDARDQEGREKAFLTIRLLHRLKLTFEASLSDGKLAKHEMEHKQGLVDRAKHSLGLDS